MDNYLLPVDPDRQAALRCLYEVYRVPVELILRVTHYSPLTVERWIKVDEWVSMNSVDTLNQRFIDVLQSCLDELGAPQTEANTTVSDARIRLLQNLAKALETAVTVDTRLRDAKGKEEGRDGPAAALNNKGRTGGKIQERDFEPTGSITDLDETLARLADRLATSRTERSSTRPHS